MIIFLSPNYNHLSISAKSLLNDFVKEFGSLYGNHFISHNVHGLIHLYDNFEKFGCLDNISCFKFENYMIQLKKIIRKHEKPLQQIVRRYLEQSIKVLDNNKNTKNINDEPQFEMPH